MQKWADGGTRCRGALIFITLFFSPLHFENNNCLLHNRIKPSLLIMSEDEGGLQCVTQTLSNSV